MNYHYGDLASIPFLHPLGFFLFPILFVVIAWVLVIKGLALWRAARSTDKVWFVILLVVNTFGILEVIYLLWINKNKGKVAPTVAEAPSNV